jgi:hypothetical protein
VIDKARHELQDSSIAELANKVPLFVFSHTRSVVAVVPSHTASFSLSPFLPHKVEGKLTKVAGQEISYAFLTLTFLVLVGSSTILFNYFKVCQSVTCITGRFCVCACVFLLLPLLLLWS